MFRSCQVPASPRSRLMHSRKSHHTLKKIPTYSFHSTPTTLKKQNLDRRMKGMANDLAYKGQVKLQQMQEEAVKQGINIGASRRMSLVSANDVMDYTLPYKFSQLPMPYTVLFWKYWWFRFVSGFKTKLFYPIRIYNHFKKQGKTNPIGSKKNVDNICANLYLKFNSDRAKHDFASIENYLGSKFFAQVQSDLSGKKLPPNLHFKWESLGDLKLKRMSARLVECGPGIPEMFYQVVYRIVSTQKVTAINKDGEEVGSTPYTTVTDYFGFEKELSGDSTPWIIISQLTEPDRLLEPNDLQRDPRNLHNNPNKE